MYAVHVCYFITFGAEYVAKLQIANCTFLKFSTSRELVLGTDSFIDSFTTPDHEEASTVDQLGLPTRNPFLTGKNSAMPHLSE